MRFVVVAVCLLVACRRPADVDSNPDEQSEGVDVLGGLSHDIAKVHVDVMADSSDGLDVPRDIAFDPEVPDRAWIVNRADDSVTLLHDVGSDDMSSEHRIDPYAFHFMEEVSSLAFGASGTFGTCQESVNTYNHQQQGDYFMGPALWSSDLDIFAESNPEAVEYLSNLYGFYVDLGSHLDMMHDSPNCMGIAWQEDNVYWVFDGYHGAISQYDFREDHGPGYDFHEDGTIYRYVEGEVKREAGVHAGMWLDPDSALLYLADGGNGRVAVLDTTSGTEGDPLEAVYETYDDHYSVDDADLSTLVDGTSAEGLSVPSGLVVRDDLLIVSDWETGRLWAFDFDGEVVDWLDTNRPEALMGLAVDADGNLWVVDSDADEVLRLSP